MPPSSKIKNTLKILPLYEARNSYNLPLHRKSIKSFYILQLRLNFFRTAYVSWGISCIRNDLQNMNKPTAYAADSLGNPEPYLGTGITPPVGIVT